MRTPAGKECRYFYGDYYRGRQDEECRLLTASSPPQQWQPRFCETCPVPEILMANACPNIIFRARLIRPFPFIYQEVAVDPFCSQSKISGFDPHVGCGECHILPEIFTLRDDPNSTV